MKVNTTSKLRAISALNLPAPSVICDNGDNTTYRRIQVTPEMAAWIARHPEASAPEFKDRHRDSVPSGTFFLQRRLRDKRKNALSKDYPYRAAAKREWKTLLESIRRNGTRPALP